jgi:hypothetical protein
MSGLNVPRGDGHTDRMLFDSIWKSPCLHLDRDTRVRLHKGNNKDDLRPTH